MSESKGVLYIVATPIGNLADISQRAIQVLSEVDLIAAEDTRNSRKLLNQYDIRVPMMALHEHNERDQTDEIIEKLLSGVNIAIISDAGTPLISDPGYYLVAATHDHQIRVVPIPGPSAVISALSAAGLATDRFTFEGFLPGKQAAREERLRALCDEPRTMVFYEAPHRLLDSLQAMRDAFGPERPAVLARELTKLYETVRRGTLAELVQWVQQSPEQQKGESVLVLAGNRSVASDQVVEVSVDRLLQSLMARLSLRDSAQLVSQLTGLSKNRLYNRALELQHDEPD